MQGIKLLFLGKIKRQDGTGKQPMQKPMDGEYDEILQY